MEQTNFRNSFMELNKPYFWTSTINNWIHLFKDDKHKDILIESLQWLSKHELMAIYGFTIMPNHVHFLWEQLQMNGKEYPKGSFEKFTAHKLQRSLQSGNLTLLKEFENNTYDRKYNFWQRDPLAVEILSREMAIQKLDYMHNNPLQEHWRLASSPTGYKYSSASFYESGKDEFNMLTHFMDRF